MILPDYKVEIDQAKNWPESHKHIGFSLDSVIGENTREQQEDQESDQNKQTDATDEMVYFRAFLTGNLENRNGCKTIYNSCSYGRDIYDPAGRCYAQKRNRQREKKHFQRLKKVTS